MKYAAESNRECKTIRRARDRTARDRQRVVDKRKRKRRVLSVVSRHSVGPSVGTIYNWKRNARAETVRVKLVRRYVKAQRYIYIYTRSVRYERYRHRRLPYFVYLNRTFRFTGRRGRDDAFYLRRRRLVGGRFPYGGRFLVRRLQSDYNIGGARACACHVVVRLCSRPEFVKCRSVGTTAVIGRTDENDYR